MAEFRWPEGKMAALSLTFDDACPSQLDTAMPILDEYGMPATFYVSPSVVEPRLEDWRRVAAAGVHEIGNHTMTHPCSRTYEWSRENALEDYTIERIVRDIEEANDYIRSRLGVSPATFAYPCGQKSVGPEESQKSYVPMVAERFAAARSAFETTANDPLHVDFADVAAVSVDGATAQDMLAHAKKAASKGQWLVFLSHEVGQDPGPITLAADELYEFCAGMKALALPLWVDTVERIGRYISEHRGEM